MSYVRLRHLFSVADLIKCPLIKLFGGMPQAERAAAFAQFRRMCGALLRVALRDSFSCDSSCVAIVRYGYVVLLLFGLDFHASSLSSFYSSTTNPQKKRAAF